MLFLLKDTYRRDIMNVDPDKIKELDDSYSLTLVVDHEGEFTDDET